VTRLAVTRSSRRARGERGAVAVEFGLIAPLLMLMVFGILEFGYMMNRDMLIGNASRDGARNASLGATYQQVCDAVKSELSSAGFPVPTSCANGISSTSPTEIRICVQVASTECTTRMTASAFDAAVASGNTVGIKVTHTYSWITPVISQLFGGSTTLAQYTQMRVE